MSDFSEVHTFSGTGLNSDDAWDAIAHGDSPVRFNSDNTTDQGRRNIVMDEGDYGRVVNMLGNSKTGVNWKTGSGTGAYTPPTGDPIVISQCYDKENEAAIFFIRESTNGNHAILRYYHITKEVEKILWSDGDSDVLQALNFGIQVSHSSTTSATILTTTSAFDVDALIGMYVYNVTDGSSALITDNTATTVTVSALAGGTDNDFDNGDICIISSIGNYGGSPYDLIVDHIDKPDVVGDGSESRLMYTDNVNKPRDINIKKAVNYTLSSGTPIYSAISDNVISINRRPGLALAGSMGSTGVSVNYGGLSSILTNNVRDKFFQFTYRVIYDDYSYSTCIPFLESPIIGSGITPNGTFTSNIYNDSFIVIDIVDDDADMTSALGYELFVRLLDDGNGVPGEWRKVGFFERILSASGATIRFSNNEVLEAVDQTEIAQHFDAIPQKARTQSVLNGNRICFGGITDGYDMDLDINRNTDYFIDYAIKSVDYTTGTYSDLCDSTGTSIDLSLGGTGFLSYYVLITESTNEKVYRLEYVNGLSATSLGDAIVQVYDDDPISGVSVVNTAGVLTITSTGGTATLFVDGYNTFDIYKTIKSGSTVNLGVIYYDEYYKFSSVKELGSVEIPNNGDSEITEWFVNGASSTKQTNRVNAIRFELDYEPPTWAKYYQFCITDTQIEDFIQIRSGYFTNGGISDTGSGLKMNIPHIQSLLPDGYNLSSLFNVDETWYIRAIEESGMNNDFSVVGRVLSNDGTNIYTENIRLGNSNFRSYEFIKYRNTDNAVYRAIGEVAHIDENRNHNVSTKTGWNRYDSGSGSFVAITTQDQNLSTGDPAIGVLDISTAYVNRPIWTTADVNYIETKSMSPYFSSNAIDYGRPALVDEFGTFKRQELNALRYGNTYTDNTLINNISQFPLTVEYFKPLNDEYGRVRALRVVGNVLKAFQDKKVTSIYLGQRMATDASNAPQVTYSNSVLDAINVSDQEYGTVHPESVFVTQRHIYFFDWKNYGCVVRDSANGMVNISEYKMSRYFRQKYNLFKDNGISDLKVHMQYDPQTMTIYVTYRSTTNPELDETVGFHEPTNRWFSFYGFTPEKYARIGEKDLISFVDGEVFYHNTDAVDRNSYYGNAAEDSVISFVANENPIAVKVYDSIEYSSNKRWGADNNNDIYIEPYADAPNGMSSRLKAAKFRIDDGVYKAAFMRDMLSDANLEKTLTGADYKVNNLFRGRRLRGRSMKVKLTNSDTSKVYLTHIKVNSTLSK